MRMRGTATIGYKPPPYSVLFSGELRFPFAYKKAITKMRWQIIPLIPQKFYSTFFKNHIGFALS